MVTVCPSQFTTNQNVKKRPACSELRWAYCNHKATYFASYLTGEIGRAVQQECRDRARMPSSAGKKRSYTLPKFEDLPATVAISLDGTCMLMGEDGWRQTMVGTLSFYDRDCERQHPIYLSTLFPYTTLFRSKASCV